MHRLPVRRIEMPTPYAVGPVNAYLIEAEPVTLVDAGLNTPQAKQRALPCSGRRRHVPRVDRAGHHHARSPRSLRPGGRHPRRIPRDGLRARARDRPRARSPDALRGRASSGRGRHAARAPFQDGPGAQGQPAPTVEARRSDPDARGSYVRVQERRRGLQPGRAPYAGPHRGTHGPARARDAACFSPGTSCSRTCRRTHFWSPRSTSPGSGVARSRSTSLRWSAWPGWI